jgi:hypothetical protein
MKLMHYSHAPVTEIHSMGQATGRALRGDKPNGFWVSVKGNRDWPEFCYNEQWNLESFKHAFEIALVDSARILHIDSYEMLCAFSKNYGNRDRVDWMRVASEYQGIVIAPYQWDARYSLNWYYSWDVASGCIWDAKAISRVVDAPHEVPNWATQRVA